MRSPELAADYVRRARARLAAVDALFVGDRRATVQTFIEQWLELKQGDVSVVAAVGWDALMVAAQALNAEGADVSANLLATELVDPVGGLHGFTAERTARRDWTLLTVRSGAVAPLYPAADEP